MADPEFDEILHSARILIAEDDEDMQSLLARHFLREGFRNVETAPDGKEALRRVLDATAGDTPYDLLVLDLLLPGELSGQDVYQSLCTTVDMPIVVVTAVSDKEAQYDALQYLDVEEYFVKPLDLELFMLKCDRILTRQVFSRRLLVSNRRSQKLFLNVLQVMAKVLEAKDPYTRFHSENVAKYARQIARRFGYVGDQLELIQIAGILHDFGKIGITEGVLNKRGSLTDKEYESVQRHPLIASTILEPIEELQTVICDIRHHHERYDGSGYPDGLKGEEIPLGARILAVADAYDAMTSARSYHQPRSDEEAREEMTRCRGEQFDPAAVNYLLEVLDENAARHTRIDQIRKRLG